MCQTILEGRGRVGDYRLEMGSGWAVCFAYRLVER